MSAVVSTRQRDQWAWWQAALKGVRGDFDKNDPPSGYFRNHDRSLAVWRDDDGSLQWLVSSGFSPRHVDKLCDAYASFCMRPISYEEWEGHRDTGRWSEDPTAEIEVARVIPSADGAVTRQDNNPPPEAVIADEIETTTRAFVAWLVGIGGTVSTEEQDAKAVKFQERFQALAKQADEAFEAEKAEIRKIGQAIDAKWRGPKADAKARKEEVGAAALAYRMERKKRADEEARKAKEEIDKQRAEQAKRKAEAEAANRPTPVETPIIAPAVRKAPAGFRTYDAARITDLPALAAQIAAMADPPPDFIQVVESIALKWLKAKVPVNGAVIEQRQKA